MWGLVAIFFAAKGRANSLRNELSGFPSTGVHLRRCRLLEDGMSRHERKRGEDPTKNITQEYAAYFL